MENDLLTLPIVNDLQRRQVIGMVRRFDIASAFAAASWIGRIVTAVQEGIGGTHKSDTKSGMDK